MKRTITVHECDRWGSVFESQRKVAMTINTSKPHTAGEISTSVRIELCAACVRAFEAFTSNKAVVDETDRPMYAGDGSN